MERMQKINKIDKNHLNH